MSDSQQMWNLDVEYLRGFAIILVVTIHTVGYFSQMNSLNLLFYINATLDVFAHNGVPMFVFISGFVLTLHYYKLKGIASIKNFYQKRMSRVLIPYLSFSIFYLILYQIIVNFHLLQGSRELNGLTVPDVLYRLSTGTAHYHLWFFFLILELYFLYPYIIRICEYFERKKNFFFLIIIAFILQIASSIFDYCHPSDFHVIIIFCDYILYFVMGIWVSRHFFDIREPVIYFARKKMPLILFGFLAISLVLSAIFILNFTIFIDVVNPVFFLYLFLFPVNFVLVLVLLFLFADNLSRTQHSHIKNSLMVLSRWSFPIYLIHPFFIEAIFYLVFPRFGITCNNWLFYPILLISGLMLSIMTIGLFKKIPGMSVIFGLR